MNEITFVCTAHQIKSTFGQVLQKISIVMEYIDNLLCSRSCDKVSGNDSSSRAIST